MKVKTTGCQTNDHALSKSGERRMNTSIFYRISMIRETTQNRSNSRGKKTNRKSKCYLAYSSPETHFFCQMIHRLWILPLTQKNRETPCGASRLHLIWCVRSIAEPLERAGLRPENSSVRTPFSGEPPQFQSTKGTEGVQVRKRISEISR